MAAIHSCMLILLIGMTASIVGMWVNNNRTNTANEFLISKWKIWYKALDVNQDGKVSMEDLKELKKKVSDLEHLDIDKATLVTEVFTKYWEECIFVGRKGDILEHEFVYSSESYFNTNAEEYVEEMRRCFELIDSAFDINKDNSISKEELHIAHTASGIQKRALDNNNSSGYDPKNGSFIVLDIVDYLVHFSSSTNESNVGLDDDDFDLFSEVISPAEVMELNDDNDDMDINSTAGVMDLDDANDAMDIN